MLIQDAWRIPLRDYSRQHYNYLYMDELDEIRLRMRITKLEARLALCEIESAALTREINSPLTSFERRKEARKSLDAARSEQANLFAELNEMRSSYPGIHH